MTSLPLPLIKTTYTKSSGPGGQNVNKVSTKAQVSFPLHTSTWIPIQVREVLAINDRNRVNKKGEIAWASDRFRTQRENFEDCLKKIVTALVKASYIPKEASEEQKERVEMHKEKMKTKSVFRKGERSNKKQNRKIDF